MPFKQRDVVKVRPEFGSRSFVIVSVQEDGYQAVLAQDKRRNKTYFLQESQIAEKLGESDDDRIFAQEPDLEEMYLYALAQAEAHPDEREQWLFLAKLLPGNKLRLVHRNYHYEAEFVQLNIHRPLYPIRAKIKDKTFDFPLRSLILGLQ